jgi:hypothetical protein
MLIEKLLASQNKGYAGGYSPKISLTQERIARNISNEAMSVIESYASEKLDRKNLVYLGDTGAANHLEENEVRFVIIGLALRIDEETIFNSIKEEREKEGKQVPYIRSLSYYRKKYAELIDEIWVTVATRIGEVYSFTDKVYRLSRYNELANALEDYVIPTIKAGIIDKSLAVATNLYMNTLRNINAEMGGITLEKVSTRKPSQDKEQTVVVDGVDVTKTLEDLVAKRFQAQLPEYKKIENGIGTPITEPS